MIYITGDTHGDFRRIFDLCMRFETSVDDIMVILGDAGINFSGGFKDQAKKDYIAAMPITLFCIHGNHEQRPFTISSYEETEWHGGIAYVEKEYPNILFAKDGEIFDLDGLKTVAIGGAYSIDKMMRIAYGWGWWEDEQPSEEIKQYVEQQLTDNNWKVDVVLSHTTPLKYEPVEVFLSGVDQNRVDKSTEKWLDGIEDRLESEKYIMLYENNGMGSFYIPIDKEDIKHSLNTIPIAGILISIREAEQIVQVDKIYCKIEYEKFIPELMKQVINYADFYGLKVSISLSRRMSVSHHSSLY